MKFTEKRIYNITQGFLLMASSACFGIAIGMAIVMIVKGQL